MKRLLKMAVAVALVAIAVALVVKLGHRPPSGPVDVAWDDAACAECRMHVGDPAFAAQLQTDDGDVLAFDDPGCLLRYEAREKPRVHAIYFHTGSGARSRNGWIAASDVAFVRVQSGSPMGYGLAAVRRGTPGSVSLAEARRIVAARETP